MWELERGCVQQVWQTTKGPDEWQAHQGRWLLLFWHTGAFDGVSTTELLALNQIYEQLQAYQCDVLALSDDSLNTLMAWTYHIYENTGIELLFPLAIDRTKEHQSQRMALLIDPQGRPCARMEYPNQVGRNVKEILRLLKALQTAKQEGMVIPANWEEGMALVLPGPQNLDELLQRTMEREGLCCMDWYLCFTDRGSQWKGKKEAQQMLT